MKEEIYEQVNRINYRFDFSKHGESYSSENEYINDLFKLLSIYIGTACDIKREFALENDFSRHLSGIYVNEKDVFNYIYTFSLFDDEVSDQLKNEVDKIEKYIESRVNKSKSDNVVLKLELLREKFILSKFEFFTVICALSCHMDAGFQEIFSIFYNVNSIRYPTFSVVKALYRIFNYLDKYDYSEYSNIPNKLTKYFFVWDYESNILSKPLILNNTILNYIYGREDEFEEFNDAVMLFEAEGKADNIIAYEEEYNKLAYLFDILKKKNKKSLIYIYGEKGIGKKLALKNLAIKNSLRIIFIDMIGIAEIKDEEFIHLIKKIELNCMLEDTYICINNIMFDNEENKKQLEKIIKKLSGLCSIFFLLSDLKPCQILDDNYATVQIKYDYPTYDQSLELWENLSKEYPIDKDIDFKIISSTHIMTPLQIKSSLKNAEVLTLLRNTEKITSDILNSAISSICSDNILKLAEKIQSNYTWNDLIIEESQKEILESFCNRIKYKKQVNERWNKGNKLSYGMGTSLLLYGPPGTGKTMSAHVIANELNLKLYRIDLSQIISKYIGETSKNIDLIFKEAENNNIILFFDEADALFARRGGVKDSNDKYANADTAHLLQKIEDYKGVSILATNLENNIDDAFKRRINYIVRMRNPDVNERINFWKNIFPKETRLSSDIDYKFLAENFEISGSEIKSIALQADYFAQENNEEINMDIILKAIKINYIKHGKIFEGYYNHKG